MASDEEENKKLTGKLNMKKTNYDNVLFYLNIDDDDIKELGYIKSTKDDLKFYCYYKKLNASDDTGDNVFTSNTNDKYYIKQINNNIIQRYSYEFKNNFPLIEYFYLFKKNILNKNTNISQTDDTKPLVMQPAMPPLAMQPATHQVIPQLAMPPLAMPPLAMQYTAPTNYPIEVTTTQGPLILPEGYYSKGQFHPVMHPTALQDGQPYLGMHMGGAANIINTDYDFLWKIDENKLLRFDGYENLDYGDSNKNIFSNIEKIIEKKNMYIKFFKFEKENIDYIITEDKKKIILILINTINDENIHMIYEFTYENFKSFTTDKINKRIAAKIYNSPDDYDIYILFDIVIDIKDYKYGYLEEYKNKDNFTSLSNNLKNIITYYNTIKNVNYFVLFSELEKNLKKINEIYETITINETKTEVTNVINYTITKKTDDKHDVKSEQEVNQILKLILKDLETRIKICENIENNKNINKYKKLLEFTKNIINNYISGEQTKNEQTENEIINYINNFKNCLPILLERIRYYGKNFIFE